MAVRLVDGDEMEVLLGVSVLGAFLSKRNWFNAPEARKVYVPDGFTKCDLYLTFTIFAMPRCQPDNPWRYVVAN